MMSSSFTHHGAVFARHGGALVKIIVTLVIIGVLLLAAGFIFKSQLAGMVVSTIVETQTAQIGLSEADQDAISEPIGNLAKQAIEGDLSGEKVELVLGELAQSPAAAILGVRGFAHSQVGSRDVPEEQKQQEQHICTRFNHALLAEQVPYSIINELKEIGVDEFTDEQGNTQYRVKQALSDAEIEQGLTIMKDAADAAGIAENVEPLDIKSIIQDKINSSLNAHTVP